MALTIGVDVGGTFTDVVVADGDSVSGGKLPTTADQSQAVIAALRSAEAGGESLFLHGTTAGTNALLEERGARVALVTTPGFEDVVEIGRQARSSLYDPFHDRPPPLVDRGARIGYHGDPDRLIDEVESAGAEAVAVALIRTHLDPTEELELGQVLQGGLDLPISIGAVVSPEFREYERVATTVLNAYLAPEVAGYLRRLDRIVAARRRLVMTSSGGLLPFSAGADFAGRLVLSGPAAGVIAAAALGRHHGRESVISFDMGGTSTDVCRMTGGLPATPPRGALPTGRVNRVPSLPVRTIGAGGGSIAWLDEGGALRVGPRSAGAIPGPACYRLGGTEPTVSDANLVLGRIPSHLALGGTIRLDLSAAESALAGLGAAAGLGVPETAAGVIEVVDAHMERALRAVSVEEGFDPRRSVLVAFGGAGGLHASRLARRLGMRGVLVPPLSGVFSALGLLLARPSSSVGRTVLLGEGATGIGEALAGVEAESGRTFSQHHGSTPTAVELVAEMRYRGQSHELAVPAGSDWTVLRSVFEEEHRTRFGFVIEGEPVEVVNLRATAQGEAPLTWGDLPQLRRSTRPEPASGPAVVEGRVRQVSIFRRDSVPPGFELGGPGVVVEKDAAVWLEPGDRLAVHSDGTLEITW